MSPMGTEETARRRMALLAFGACGLLGLAVYATVGRALVGDRVHLPNEADSPRLHAKSFSIRSVRREAAGAVPGLQAQPDLR